jgi:hypothetical protein
VVIGRIAIKDDNVQDSVETRYLGMKANRIPRLAAVAFATLSPLGTMAQTSPTGSPYEVSNRTTDRHDWGWIGLIGLLGLAGLMNKRRHDRVDTRTDARR